MPDLSQEPIEITLADGVKRPLNFTIGSIRRLRALEVDILGMAGSPKDMHVAWNSEKLDIVILEGLRDEDGNEPAGVNVGLIHKLKPYKLPALFTAVNLALTQALVDPEAKKDPNPPLSPSTGASSGQPVE